MNTSTLPPPRLVQTEKELQQVVGDLATQSHIAVDTESNSLFAYQEQVCLIQFSTPQTDYLVDPLSLPDLSILEPLFQNPDIEKVLHGAEYDVLCLRRDFNFKLNNLFDTRVASRTLGWPQSGLNNLLMKVFNINVNKRYQRANWGKRPLPSEMLDYARYDTHYLLQLQDHLVKELRAIDRYTEAYELCQHMAQVQPRDNGFDPEGYWRISKVRELTGRQIAVLRELYLYRDKNARKFNRPAFKILGDKVLLSLAIEMPSSREDLTEVPGMSAGQIRRFGNGILDCIRHGKKAPIPKQPKNKRLSDLAHARYEALHDWRKNLARKRKVESDIILPREMLREIAVAGPVKHEELHQFMVPLEWRFQEYGDAILDIISNNRGF